MTPRDEQMLCDAIIYQIAGSNPTADEAAAVLREAADAWEDIRDNLTELGWIEKQQFSRELARKLCDLREDAFEAAWVERNTFDDALGRKCDAAAAVEAARALK